MTGFDFLADGAGFWMPPQASDYAENVDALFYFILALSVFFFVLLMEVQRVADEPPLEPDGPQLQARVLVVGHPDGAPHRHLRVGLP
jgi:hypothetical protein